MRACPPGLHDEIIDNYFSGREAQRIADVRTNPDKFPSRIPLTDEQILEARADVLRSMGREAQAEDLVKTQELTTASRTDSTQTAQRMPETERSTGLARRADSVPGGTERMADESLAELGARRQPSSSGTPAPVGESTITAPSRRTDAGMTPTPTGVSRDVPIDDAEFQHRFADLGIEPRPATRQNLGAYDYDIITEQAKLRDFTEREAVVVIGLQNRIDADHILRVAGVTADDAPAVLERTLTKVNVPPESRAVMIDRFQRGLPVTDDSMGRLLTELPQGRYPGNLPLPTQPAAGTSGASTTGPGLPRD